MALTIYWPGQMDRVLKGFLRDIHPTEELKFIQYLIHEENDRRMREYLLRHKDDDQFVYVSGQVHVAVVMQERVRAGWFITSDAGFITSVWHSREGAGFSSGFSKVWCYKPNPMEDSPHKEPDHVM